MKRLRTFLELPGAERRVVVQAFFLAVLVQVCLWLLPFGKVNRAFRARIERYAAGEIKELLAPSKIVWLVSVACRFVPGARCLTRSMVSQLILARRGVATTLRIGVRKVGGDLDAHAWLELDGRPLFENPDHLGDFAPFDPSGSWSQLPRSLR